MKLSIHNDTIAAIATPRGDGGIAVIRLSGTKSIEVAQKIFFGKTPLYKIESRHVELGEIVIPGEGTIDTVLITIFRNPASYTGEDVVEISCHGGHYITQKILTAVIDSGARPANPGEFTLRAYLNGKLDLTQAEAVADLIHAQSERSRRASLDQLQGKLGKAIAELRTKLLNMCALLELELDFSEEGIELAKKEQYREKILEVIEIIRNIKSTYSTGKIIRDGVKVVLIGKPNAGKSSLLNILLKENRAIVSNIPGTTRDVIEENFIIDGILFRLFDTAGLRETQDEIETEGVNRAKAEIETADIVLQIVDRSIPLEQEDLEKIITIKKKMKSRSSCALLIINKLDLEKHKKFIITEEIQANAIEISCKGHTGIDELKSLLVKISMPPRVESSEGVVVQNLRHYVALEKSLESLIHAIGSMDNNLGSEFTAIDVNEAIEHLGEIIGITTPDEVLNMIFSNFCIGK